MIQTHHAKLILQKFMQKNTRKLLDQQVIFK